MGYYDNPPIINFSKGYDYSQAILSASDAFVQGMNARADRKRQEEQQRELTLRKLQERKYEVDLAYNDKLSGRRIDSAATFITGNTKLTKYVTGTPQRLIIKVGAALGENAQVMSYNLDKKEFTPKSTVSCTDNDGDGLIDEPGEKRKLNGLTRRRLAEANLYFKE